MSTAEQKYINPCVAARQIARAAACDRTSPSARDRSSTAVADRDDVLLFDFWIRIVFRVLPLQAKQSFLVASFRLDCRHCGKVNCPST
jgi:hypothetical protein